MMSFLRPAKRLFQPLSRAFTAFAPRAPSVSLSSGSVQAADQERVDEPQGDDIRQMQPGAGSPQLPAVSAFSPVMSDLRRQIAQSIPSVQRREFSSSKEDEPGAKDVQASAEAADTHPTLSAAGPSQDSQPGAIDPAELDFYRQLEPVSDTRVSRLIYDRQAPRREALRQKLESGAITQEDHDAGLRKLIDERRSILTSAQGQFRVGRGRKDQKFVATHTAGSKPSGVYVTLGSAGDTAQARRENLALPDSNTAEEESSAELTRDQDLLESEVAPQGGYAILPDLEPTGDGGERMAAKQKPPWVTDFMAGGGRQVITEGGTFSGAVKFNPLAKKKV